MPRPGPKGVAMHMSVASYLRDWLASPARGRRARPTLPTQLNFPITDNCNARCIMCDVWKEKSEGESSPREIARTLSAPLFAKVEQLGFSGGEPTLRPDLLEIVDAALESLPALRALSLTSHGFQVRRWEKLLPAIRSRARERGIALRLNLSVDGVGPVHERVRGIPGAWDKVLATSELAEALGVAVQWQCTVSARNVYGVSNLLRHARARGVEVLYRLATEIERLGNAQTLSQVELDAGQASFFADFLESKALAAVTVSPARRLLYRDLARRLGDGGPRLAPCFYQNEGLVLSAHGQLFHCSLASEAIADTRTTRNEDLNEDLLLEGRGKELRARLLGNTCQRCRHDQSGAWSPAALAREVARRSRPGAITERSIAASRLIGRTLMQLASAGPKRVSLSESRRPVRRVLLIGAYGGEHVGDAAILGGVVRRLRESHAVESFEVASSRPARTERWISSLPDTPLGVVPATRTSLRDAVARSDLVVYAGGPIMDLPEALVRHLECARAARARGLPFEIEGCGIGPFERRVSRFVAKRLIELATRICVRSEAAARDPLLAGRRVQIDRDPALDYLATRRVLDRIEAHELEAIDLVLAEGGHTPPSRRVGINLRPLWHRYGGSRRELVGTERSFLDRFSEGMRRATDAKPDTRFVFFPMNADQYGFCDLDVGWSLAERLEGSGVDFRVLEAEPGPDALLYLLRRLDAVVAMRFHAVLFALSQGVPVSGLDYAIGARGKVGALFDERGQPERVAGLLDLDPWWLPGQLEIHGAGRAQPRTVALAGAARKDP